MDSTFRPHILITPSGSVNAALYKPATQSNGNMVMASYAVDGNKSDISNFAGSMQATNQPFWQVDFEHHVELSRIDATLLSCLPSAPDSVAGPVRVWFLLSDSVFPSAFLSNARSHAKLALSILVNFQKTCEKPQVVSPSIPLRDSVSGSWTEGRFLDPRFDASASQARYLRIQAEAQIALRIIEVEAFTNAYASTNINLGSYLPSPSTLSSTNSIQTLYPPEFRDFCDSLERCRAVLEFTCQNWNTEKRIHFSIINDDVAVGTRRALVSHNAFSTDPNYDNALQCQLLNPDQVPCSSIFDQHKSVLQLMLHDDDRVGISVSRSHLHVVEGSHHYPSSKVWYRPITLNSPPLSCNNAFTSLQCQSLQTQNGFVTLDARFPQFAPHPTIVFTLPQNAKIVSISTTKNADESKQGVKTIVFDFSSSPNAEMHNVVANWSIPWGSAVSKSQFTYTWSQPVSASHVRVRILENYGGSSVIVHKFVLDVQVLITELPQRGDISLLTGMPTQLFKLSRSHLFGSSATYSILLDSEPLAPVTIHLTSSSDPKLAAWDNLNSSINHHSLANVTMGDYHWGQVSSIQSIALTFDAQTWNKPQTVRVSAVDDNINNGQSRDNRTRASFVSHLSSSSDKAVVVFNHTENLVAQNSSIPLEFSYHSLGVIHQRVSRTQSWPFFWSTNWTSHGELPVQIYDDDLAGVTLFNSVIAVAESDKQVSVDGREDNVVWIGDEFSGQWMRADADFQIVLDSQPKDDVTVTFEKIEYPNRQSVQSGKAISPIIESDQVTLSHSQLVFTSSNWHMPQRVYVTATNDNIFQGKVSSTQVYSHVVEQEKGVLVRFVLTSSDSKYDGIDIGGNEFDELHDSLPEYVLRQGLLVSIFDNDGGCHERFNQVNMFSFCLFFI